MNKIITEITPLEKKDCFYLVDRNKESFTFPLHKHEEIELNFVENCSGARRIVGDSIEILGQYDLALIGSNLEHVWEQNVCQHQKVREITIQFEPNLFGDTLLGKSQMNSIQQLLENAKNGIAFSLSAIMRIYTRLDEITKTQPGFYRVIKLLEILYELSNDTEYRKLASSSFANVQVSTESRRVRKVEEYIDTNFKQEVRLQTLADLAGMTSSAFSRFFKLRTGKTVQEYIIDAVLHIIAVHIASHLGQGAAVGFVYHRTAYLAHYRKIALHRPQGHNGPFVFLIVGGDGEFQRAAQVVHPLQLNAGNRDFTVYLEVLDPHLPQVLGLRQGDDNRIPFVTYLHIGGALYAQGGNMGHDHREREVVAYAGEGRHGTQKICKDSFHQRCIVSPKVMSIMFRWAWAFQAFLVPTTLPSLQAVTLL